MSPLVAIHQPNFLPWLGWFDKLARADVLILLDDAQFPKKGGTWTNRVRMLVGGQAGWVTVPVNRSYSGTREVRQMEIDESRPWRDKLRRTVEQSYKRAAFFEETMPLVDEVLRRRSSNLAAFNEHGLRLLATHLSLDLGKLVRSSELRVTSTATERLIDLTRSVGGDAYLAGGGAVGYQEDGKFAASGIELVTQDYRQPAYPQPTPEPILGLSVVDALMNCGAAGTARLIGVG